MLTLGATGSAQTEPWTGTSRSVDLYGSNQTLTITKRAGGGYDVLLFDDKATACGGFASNGAGVGTASGTFMTGTATITGALKVTLAGNRTRGTLTGTASTPGNEPVTGSFQC